MTITTSSTPCKFKGLSTKEVDKMVIEFITNKVTDNKDIVEQFVEEFNVDPNKLKIVETKNTTRIFLSGYGRGLNWQISWR